MGCISNKKYIKVNTQISSNEKTVFSFFHDFQNIIDIKIGKILD